MTSTASAKPVRFLPRGGNLDFCYANETETLLEGPAGTGKTRTICELLHLIAMKYPGSHQLMCRKTNTALADAAARTFREKVLLSGEEDPVWFGGSKIEPPAWRYRNGSSIVVRGLDTLGKMQSAEYDNIYVNEATELTEDEWEELLRALRNGVTPHQRLMADCNPASERHWLLRRARTRRFKTTIKDNPAYWDQAKDEYTAEGRAYVENTLGGMSGTRYQRYVLGEWVGMENAVYDNFDQAKVVVALPERSYFGDGAIGVDFGEIHNSAVCVVQVDSRGYFWVRETWAEPTKNVGLLEEATRARKLRYRINKGECDPLQDVLAYHLGFDVATKGPGTRKKRISLVYELLAGDALRIDAYGEGNQELVDEILDYRWEAKESPTDEWLEPVRKNDDRVAALEYAIEKLRGMKTEVRRPTQARRPQYRQQTGRRPEYQSI